MESLHTKTPLIHSEAWSSNEGKMNVFMKLDNLQPTGSFKIRGIGLLCMEAKKQQYTNVVSSSGGNAGMAAAHAAKKLGLEASVIVPETTPNLMVERLRNQGAEVTIHGKMWSEANDFAKAMANDNDKHILVHPFDNPLIWTGHSSIIAEMIDQMENEFGITDPPDYIVLSVGGGGLLCGVIKGLEAHEKWKSVKVIAMETEGADCLKRSLAQQQIITLPEIKSIAKSLGANAPAEECLKLATTHSILSYTVTDRQALDACLKFADDYRMLVEPACGATLASITSGVMTKVIGESTPRSTSTNIILIVCGGSSVTVNMLNEWNRTIT